MMAGQVEIIKLIIAYTLVGAFVFTVVATCGSLVGLIKFADAGQQKKLFGVLVVELAVICVGAFANLLNLNPVTTARDIQRPLVSEIQGLEAVAIQQTATTAAIADQLNSEALKGLRPEGAQAARKLIAAAREEGIDLRLWSGYRSPAQQAALYAKGRTAPGPKVTNAAISSHSTGLVFDVAVYTNSKPDFSSESYARVGAIGKAQGLVWGGDWSFPDPPHFELPAAARVLAAMKAESRARNDAGP